MAVDFQPAAMYGSTQTVPYCSQKINQQQVKVEPINAMDASGGKKPPIESEVYYNYNRFGERVRIHQVGLHINIEVL
jgi:hypothetical protein